MAVTGFVGDGIVSNNPGTLPNEDRGEDPSIVSLGPVMVMFFVPGGVKPRCDMRRYLRRKENFACVRIFYRGSRRKTDDLDVTGIRRERTCN